MSTQAVTQTPQAQPPAKVAPLKELQTLLETHKDQIAMALPRHMTPERMIRVAMTAYSTTPALHECSATSIAACIVQSSILGLEPNSVLGESYLIPFNRNTAKKGQPARWVKECQLMVGYQGLLKLVRQSGELQTVQAQSVRLNDDFDYEFGLNPFLRHKPGQGTPEERGPITHYWACANLKGGGSQFVVMTQAEIIHHRNKYSKGFEQQGQNSTWGKEEEAMALKTVLRKLCKLLPKSIEKDNVSVALGLEDHAERGRTQRFSVDVPLALHAPIDEDEADNTTEAGNVEMPKRASEKAPAEQPPQVDEVAAKQRVERKAKLEALPDLSDFPAVAKSKLTDICRVQGKFYMFGEEKCWVEYPEALEILKG